MALRLTVARDAWRERVVATAAEGGDVIPVVKGNGYGFGRAALAALACELLPARPGRLLAVGTVHEAVDVPASARALVLTPTMSSLPATLPPDAVLTVGAPEHVALLAAAGWRGDVTIKLAGAMHRYGTDDLAGLAALCQRAGLTPVAAAIHLPLGGDHAAHLAGVAGWVPVVDDVLGHDVPLDVSHVTPEDLTRLRAEGRPVRVRLGTALWHGDKALLHLGATVVDVRSVAGGEPVGYRQGPCPADGHVVLVDAGTAHGVTPLDGGLSPFHHARRRVALVEPPHMHTSMLFVPWGEPLPVPGDAVDVQRPLITTTVDEVVWA